MNYRRLESKHLDATITYHRPVDDKVAKLTLDAPAMAAMTDLKQVKLRTVAPDVNIDFAHDRMKDKGVRMLLVVDDTEHIIGIITANDLLGEKPIQYVQNNGVKHHDIMVADIMSTKLEVLYISDVSQARLGDIVRTLHDVDRQHAIVIDHQGLDNRPTVRGIISLSQIARLIGKSVNDFTINKMVEHILN